MKEKIGYYRTSIGLPKTLADFAQDRVRRGSFGTMSAYVQSLIRDDRERSYKLTKTFEMEELKDTTGKTLEEQADALEKRRLILVKEHYGTIFDEGWLAFHQGKAVEDCPYYDDEEDASSFHWRGGHDCAEDRQKCEDGAEVPEPE